MSVRLENYILRSDVCIYDEIKILIKSGKIKVNGVVQKDINFKVDAISDFVDFEDKVLCYRRYVYIMLNKPEGFMTKTKDRHFKTIMELLPDWCTRRRIKPINILDKGISGLILLTDDSSYHHYVQSQMKSTKMVYHVQTDKPAVIKHVDMFANSIRMKHYTGRSAILSKADSYYEDEFASRLTMNDSNFSDIKKMFNAVGISALSAELIALGDLVLSTKLDTGQWRELKSDELATLHIPNPYL